MPVMVERPHAVRMGADTDGWSGKDVALRAVCVLFQPLDRIRLQHRLPK